MLHSISWQEFLTTVALVVGMYYSISFLLLYSNEIKSVFKKGRPEGQRDTQDADSVEQDNGLVGKTRPEASLAKTSNTVSTEDIRFQPSEEEEDIPVSSSQANTLVIGVIADLLQESKALAEVVEGSSREEAISLFKSLLARYATVAGTHYQQAVSLHIYTILSEHGFNIELGEIQKWWAVK